MPACLGRLLKNSMETAATEISEEKDNINFSGQIPGRRTPRKELFAGTEKVNARPFSTVKHSEFLT